MNKEEQIKTLDSFTKKMFETITKKGNDYAGIDRLSNFKSRATFLGTTTEKILLGDILLKVTRLKELINNDKVPENESIQDTLLDLSCYSFLNYCVLEEKNKLPETDSNNISIYVNNENTKCSVCDSALVLGSRIYSYDICSYDCYLKSLNFNEHN